MAGVPLSLDCHSDAEQWPVGLCVRHGNDRVTTLLLVVVSLWVFVDQGYLGIPTGGFPEPLRTRIIKDRKLPGGHTCFVGRPGVEMKVCVWPHDDACIAAVAASSDATCQ